MLEKGRAPAAFFLSDLGSAADPAYVITEDAAFSFDRVLPPAISLIAFAFFGTAYIPSSSAPSLQRKFTGVFARRAR